MKKSALSAALAGGAPAPTPATVGPAQSKGTFFDPSAFPCIEYADVIDGVKTEDELGAAVDQLGKLDFADVAIVGSAPTNVLLDGVTLVSCFVHSIHFEICTLVGESSTNPCCKPFAAAGGLPA